MNIKEHHIYEIANCLNKKVFDDIIVDEDTEIDDVLVDKCIQAYEDAYDDYRDDDDLTNFFMYFDEEDEEVYHMQRQYIVDFIKKQIQYQKKAA